MTINPSALPCPFCGERLKRDVMTNGEPVWSHSLAEPCVLRGLAVSTEGLPMWNRRPDANLLEALKLLRGLIKEGGGPRYTMTPGAALNAIVEEIVDPAIAKAEGR